MVAALDVTQWLLNSVSNLSILSTKNELAKWFSIDRDGSRERWSVIYCFQPLTCEDLLNQRLNIFWILYFGHLNMDLSVLGNCEEFSDFSGQNTQDEMRSDDENHSCTSGFHSAH